MLGSAELVKGRAVKIREERERMKESEYYKKSNIYSKIKLVQELAFYDKVKNNEQAKALADFLEYLFLIQDEELKEKYKENIGGVSNMSIDEIRKIYYEQKGIEEGIEQGKK